MARRRRYSEEGFGPTIEALMAEAGVTYRELAARTGLSGLSMGMSQDFETGIEEGATHIRVGTAIFEGVVI